MIIVIVEGPTAMPSSGVIHARDKRVRHGKGRVPHWILILHVNNELVAWLLDLFDIQLFKTSVVLVR